MITFKHSHLEGELDQLAYENEDLLDIVYDLAAFVESQFDKAIVITSIYREGDSGVHGVWRGVDLRSFIYTDQELELIELYVNSKYEYDYRRPTKDVLLCHDAGSGDHIHLQNHPNTSLRD